MKGNSALSSFVLFFSLDLLEIRTNVPFRMSQGLSKPLGVHCLAFKLADGNFQIWN